MPLTILRFARPRFSRGMRSRFLSRMVQGAVKAAEAIAFCNKIALRDIASGEEVLKYGEVIGKATEDIRKGCLVNDRNIASQPRAYADEYLLKKEA